LIRLPKRSLVADNPLGEHDPGAAGTGDLPAGPLLAELGVGGDEGLNFFDLGHGGSLPGV